MRWFEGNYKLLLDHSRKNHIELCNFAITMMECVVNKIIIIIKFFA